MVRNQRWCAIGVTSVIACALTIYMPVIRRLTYSTSCESESGGQQLSVRVTAVNQDLWTPNEFTLGVFDGFFTKLLAADDFKFVHETVTTTTFIFCIP